MTALHALTTALLDLQDAGRTTPCQGPDAHLWTSEDADDRQRAARAYIDPRCPLLVVCDNAADEIEAWGTWGGVVRDDRTPSLERFLRLLDRRTHRTGASS
jgi:hypothetical protein